MGASINAFNSAQSRDKTPSKKKASKSTQRFDKDGKEQLYSQQEFWKMLTSGQIDSEKETSKQQFPDNQFRSEKTWKWQSNANDATIQSFVIPES